MALKSHRKSDNVDFDVDVKDNCHKSWMALNMRTKSYNKAKYPELVFLDCFFFREATSTHRSANLSQLSHVEKHQEKGKINENLWDQGKR